MKLKDIFWVLFISMVPLIELRGAIPVGTMLGLPFSLNYALAVIGNLIPVPFILIMIPFVLNFLYRFEIFKPLVDFVRRKADKNKAKIQIESSEYNENKDVIILDKDGKCLTQKKNVMPSRTFLGLMLFVLLPIPGTGAWTGALVASLFDFPKLKSFCAIAIGVAGCGLIMCLASYGILGFLSFLL